MHHQIGITSWIYPPDLCAVAYCKNLEILGHFENFFAYDIFLISGISFGNRDYVVLAVMAE